MATRISSRTAPGSVQTPAQMPVRPQPQETPEGAVVKAALGFQEITLDIPSGATLLDVQHTLGIAVEGYKRLENGLERIKPIIGRLLLHIQETKKFRPSFKNFSEWLDTVVVGEMGFGRSTAFDALRIARAFPTMSTDDYQNYGATRLLIAARYTDETHEDYRKVLDESTQMTTDQFADSIHTRLIEGKPPAQTVVLSMRVSPETKQRWDVRLEGSGVSPDEFMTALLYLFDTQPRATQPPPLPGKA